MIFIVWPLLEWFACFIIFTLRILNLLALMVIYFCFYSFKKKIHHEYFFLTFQIVNLLEVFSQKFTQYFSLTIEIFIYCPKCLRDWGRGLIQSIENESKLIILGRIRSAIYRVGISIHSSSFEFYFKQSLAKKKKDLKLTLTLTKYHF